MEVIQSFTIDHTQLKPGIYVSRVDKGFTTFDLRITEPNKEPAVAPAAIHSIEHLMATWFRNSEAKEDVVYVGPMGCLTGMYIIMTGTYSVEDMRRLTIEKTCPFGIGFSVLTNMRFASTTTSDLPKRVWMPISFGHFLRSNGFNPPPTMMRPSGSSYQKRLSSISIKRPLLLPFGCHAVKPMSLAE